MHAVISIAPFETSLAHRSRFLSVVRFFFSLLSRSLNGMFKEERFLATEVNEVQQLK